MRRPKSFRLNPMLLNGTLALGGLWLTFDLLERLGPWVGFIFGQALSFLTPFLWAFGLAFLLNPCVEFFTQKFRLKRPLAIALTFFLIVGLILWGVLAFIPYLTESIQGIWSQIPALGTKLQALWNELDLAPLQLSLEEFRGLLGESSKWFNMASSYFGQFFDWASSLSSTITNFFVLLLLVPVLLFYTLLYFETIRQGLKKLLVSRNQQKWVPILSESEQVVNGFISGTLLDSFILGVLSTLLFMAIGVDYAVVFGLIAGLTNVIPYVGPLLGMIPAAIYALTISTLAPLYVVVGTVLLNAIEGNFIKPFVFAKAIDLHPALMLVLIVMGGQWFGIVGMLFIVPIAGMMKVILKHWWQWQQASKKAKESH